jgi:hypothetical protein
MLRKFKKYTGNLSSQSLNENDQRLNILDIVQSKEIELNDTWQTFYAPSPISKYSLKGAVLFSICRTKIEYDDTDCELVFIMDQSSQMQHMNE